VISTVKKLKLAGSVDASDLSEAVKEYRIPFSSDVDGVKVPVSLVQLVDGTKRPIPLVSPSSPWGNGVPTWMRDATANDSDKSFSVPAGKIWLLKSVWLLLTATATVGNRVIRVEIENVATNPMSRWDIGVNQAASTTYAYLYGPSVPVDVTGSGVSMGTPEIILTEGMIVRAYDTAAIDAAADDLTVVLHYVEYDA